MADDLDVKVDDYDTSSGNIVKEIEAAYNTSLESDNVVITYSGKRSNSLGQDDAVYDVENSGIGASEDHMVPISIATVGEDQDPLEAVHEVTETVLEKYADLDNGKEWAVGALE